MNIKINQRTKGGILADTIKKLKSFKSNLSRIASESAERVRNELVKSGRKHDRVVSKIVSRENQHGVRIEINTPTETIGAETLVQVTDKDVAVPLGLLNEQADTTEDDGNIFGVKKETEMMNRMMKRILNEVFYKYL